MVTDRPTPDRSSRPSGEFPDPSRPPHTSLTSVLDTDARSTDGRDGPGRQPRRSIMTVISKLGIGIVAGALTIGAGASAFAAGPSGSTGGTPRGARATFVCANLDQLQTQQQAHL